MFKKYNLKVKKLLSDEKEGASWKKILTYHKLMIARIQHERLIHLLVTIFVGICFILCFLVFISTPYNLLLGILTLAFLILCFAYILHYRFLENTTQKWYEFEDEISKKVKI